MKIWLCRDEPKYCGYWDRPGVILFPKEPEWDGEMWKDGLSGDPVWMCRSQVERILGVKIPKRPGLVEVEIKAKQVCAWQPEGD